MWSAVDQLKGSIVGCRVSSGSARRDKSSVINQGGGGGGKKASCGTNRERLIGVVTAFRDSGVLVGRAAGVFPFCRVASSDFQQPA